MKKKDLLGSNLLKGACLANLQTSSSVVPGVSGTSPKALTGKGGVEGGGGGSRGTLGGGLLLTAPAEPLGKGTFG